MSASKPVPELVTLGLPIYDGERFLVSTLDALLAQTYQHFELVVGDNASQDSSLEIVRDYARRDSRIRILEADHNHGAAWNYNRVYDEGRGEYFKWAAADDLCRPECLQRCVQALAEDSRAVLAYPRTRIIDEHGVDLGPYEDAMHLDQPRAWRRFARLVRALRECNAVFGVIRRSALEQTGRIGAFTGSDLVLLGELSLRGRFVEVPEELFLRRDHPAQSVRAHPDLAARNAWFDVDRFGERSSPMWRIFAEYWRCLDGAPVGLGQRVLGRLALAYWWPRNKYRELIVEALAAARITRGSPAPPAGTAPPR